jgi:hypothetical protein
MIDPGGLVLVVCCPTFSFMGGIEKKEKKLNLDVKNILAGSHTEKHKAEDALSGSYISR